MPLLKIEQAIRDIKDGKMVILVDDEDRENEGDLCIAAESVTPEAIRPFPLSLSETSQPVWAPSAWPLVFPTGPVIHPVKFPSV